MGKKSFWQSLRKKKWLASTGILAAGALAVYGVWQIPSLNQYHMETLETPITDENQNENTNHEDTNANTNRDTQNQENNGFDLPRDTKDTEDEEENKENEIKDNNKNTEEDTNIEKETIKETKEEDLKVPETAENTKSSQKQQKKKKSNEKIEEKKDSIEVLSNPQSVLDAGNFDESDGLSWPIQGDIILNYDTDGVIYFQTLAQYKANPAIMISGEVGNKVKASAAGIVEEIIENEETGVTVKTSVGNSYEIIYGQLENLKVKEGDTIKEGSVIGTLAEPTDYFTIEGANLYYQILQNETPVNPLLLLK